ncbi:MAG: Fic family protein [Verrucomicrobiota bacterium]
MQVVSGSIGKEKIHFEAPPSERIPAEMKAFIEWFNQTSPEGKSPIKRGPARSAMVHLYFETIHPFEEGNGRIGRTLSEMVLSQEMERPILLSLSPTVEANKKSYYEALMEGQRSNEISSWIYYFIKTVLDAQVEA